MSTLIFIIILLSLISAILLFLIFDWIITIFLSIIAFLTPFLGIFYIIIKTAKYWLPILIVGIVLVLVFGNR